MYEFRFSDMGREYGTSLYDGNGDWIASNDAEYTSGEAIFRGWLTGDATYRLRIGNWGSQALSGTVSIATISSVLKLGDNSFHLNDGETFGPYTFTPAESGSYILSSQNKDDYTEVAEHSFGDTVTVAPTCKEYGYDVRTCSVCGYKEYSNYNYNHPDHSWEDLTGEEYPSKEPTETENGYKWVRCKNCGDERSITLPALGHTHSITASNWNWNFWASEPYVKEVTFRCEDCGFSEQVTVSGKNVTSEVTKEPTCTRDGIKTWTATVEYEGKTYTETYDEYLWSLEHNYVETAVTREATCTDSGERTCECKRCHETYTELISPLGHSYGEWTVTKPSSCGEDGEATSTCTRCQHQKTRVLEASPHDWDTPVWTWAEDYSSASVTLTCKKNASHTVTQKATIRRETVDADCENAGEVVCTATAKVNGETFTDTKTVNNTALGHDWRVPYWTWSEDGTEATATFVCKNNSSHRDTVTASGDAITSEAPVEGSCTEGTQVTRTATVTHDGKTFTNTKTFTADAPGHKWGEPVWQWDKNHNATAVFTCENDPGHTVSVRASTVSSSTVAYSSCTQGRKVEYTASLLFNDQLYTDTVTETGEPEGHIWYPPVWSWNDEHTAATATFVCGRDNSHTTTVDAVIISDTAVSCGKNGTVTYTATVTLDGLTYTDTKTDEVTALAHDWQTPTWTWNEEHTAATATFVCSRNDSHTTTVDAVVTTQTNPDTCEEAGGTVYTATVTLEGKEYTDTYRQDGQALGHDWDTPTWSWNGDHTQATATFICKRDVTHFKTLTATGEDITEETTAATCTEDGKTVYTAKVTLNGTEYTNSDTVTLNQLGHNWKAPTWEWNNDHTEATATFKCGNDTSHTHKETATGKAITADETAATCDSAKSVKYTAKVSFNGEEYTDSVSVTEGEALGHDWGEWSTVNDATCTEKGKEQRECGNCHQTEERSTDALGHSWGKWTVKKAATCTGKGKEQRECGNCHQTEERSTDALGHDWDSGKVTREPTADATGLMTYTCKRCSTTRTEPIPKLVNAGPTKKNVITVNAKGFTVEGKTNLVKTTYNTKKVTLDLKASAQGGAKLSYKSSNKKKLPVKNGKVTIPAKFIGSTTITITSAATQDYKAATLKLTLQVNPTKTKLNTLTNVKGKKLTVKWSENNTCKGYQVAYSTDKKFKKGTVTKNIGKQKTTSVTLTGLTLKKQYYVRVRTVSGKNYSDWSNVKNIEISK